jgi:RHS repeat-associated protein
MSLNSAVGPRTVVRSALAVAAIAFGSVPRLTAQDPSFRAPTQVGQLEALGAEPGSFAVSAAGEALWSWPLTVPSGRNGIEPELSLNYGSRRRASGVFGVGFELAGLSAITRCWPTIAQDGSFATGTPAGVPPAFCLDGQRLMARSANPLELQPEFDPGVMVRIVGPGADPTAFTVFHRNGRIARYGSRDAGASPSNARVQARPLVVTVPLQADGTGLAVATTDLVSESNGPQVRTVSWLVDRVEDRYGNYLDADYERTIVPGSPDTVEVVPLEVRWTGFQPASGTAAPPTRRLRVVYGTSRQDIRVAFVAGVAVRASRRVDRIDVFAPRGLVSDASKPETKFREYRFEYLPPSPGRRAVDRLQTIRECVFDTAGTVRCRDPITLDWADATAPDIPSFGPARVLNDAADLAVGQNGLIPAFATDVYDMTVGDFDGDGRDDVLYRLPARTPLNRFVDLNGGVGDPMARGDWFLRRGSAAGLGPRQAMSSLPSTPGGEWRFSGRAVDVDGDGAQELILYSEPLPPSSPLAANAYTVFRLACTPSGCSFSALPSLNEVISIPALTGWPRRSFSLQVGDLDGDGRTDLVRENSTGPGGPGTPTRLGLRSGTPTGFALPASVLSIRLPTPGTVMPVSTRLFDERYAIDVDGNGQLDLLAPVRNPTPPVLNLRADPFTFSAITTIPGGGSPNATFAMTTLHSADVESSLLIESLVRTTPCVPNLSLPPTGLVRLFLDLNGDGLRDSVAFSSEARDLCAVRSILNSRVFLASNIGTGFRRAVQQILPSSAGFNPTRAGIAPNRRSVDGGARVVDLDQDGRDDVLQVSQNLNFPHPNGDTSTRVGAMVWLRSTGSGFAPITLTVPSAEQLYTDINGNLGTYGPRLVQLGDFNGDGLPDIVMPSGARLAMYLQTARPAPAISRISGGPRVASIGVGYAWAGPNAPQLYTRAASCSLPQNCPRSLGWVVRSVSREVAAFDASTVGRNLVEYSYSGGRVDLLGRGFLGVDRLTTRERDDASPPNTLSAETVDFDLTLASRVCRAGSATRCAYPQLGFPVKRSWSVPIDATSAFLRETRGGRDLVARSGDSGYRTAAQRMSVVESEYRTGASPATLRSERVTTTYDVYGNAVASVEESSAAALPLTGPPPGAQVVRRRERQSADPAPADEANWLIGRFATRRTVSVDPSLPAGQQSRSQTTTLEYVPGSVEVRRSVDEPTPAATETPTVSGFTLETVLTRDGRGTVTGVRQTGSGEVRETLLDFHANDGDRIFPWKETNAVNHVEYVWADAATGLPQALDDANGIRTTLEYDTLGRIRAQRRPGAAAIGYRYITPTANNGLRILRSAIGCRDDAAFGSVCETVDPLQRVVSRTAPTFGGSVSTTYGYDRQGSVVTSDRPGPNNSTSIRVIWRRDGLGRVVRTERTGETWTRPPFVSTTEYRGRRVDTTSERGTITRSEFDDRGRLVARTTFEGSTSSRSVTTRFEYGHDDQLLRVVYPVLPASQAMTPPPPPLEARYAYDLLGRRERLEDPSLGAVQYRYNAFGEMKRFEDATGAVTTFSYDRLGRLTGRRTPATATYASPVGNPWARDDSFVYDSATNGIGSLHRAVSNEGVQTEHVYDSFGRLATQRWTVAGGLREFTFGYDTVGRLATIRHPTAAGRDFMARYDYAGNGDIREVNDVTGPSPRLIWRQVERTPAGQNAVEQFGVAARMERVYDGSGALRFVNSTLLPGGSSFMRVSYRWVGDGLLAGRTDVDLRVSEAYRHDFLGRLDLWRVAQNCAPVEWAYRYDDWGNLREVAPTAPSTLPATRLDYTTATDTSRPQAVKTLTEGTVGEAQLYDAAGQLRSSGTAVYTWTPHGLPRQISGGGRTRTFTFDAFGRPVASTEAGTSPSVTLALGGAYVERSDSSGVEAVYSIHGNDGPVAQLLREASADRLLFIHSDHLGNPAAVTSEVITNGVIGGTVLGRGSYEPFGARRHPWAIAHPQTAPPGPLRDHEFTGHGSEAPFDLLDMGGRFYATRLRRFLSPDPLDQFGSSQSLNRYSYVLNSPVGLTDPSGFTAGRPEVPQVPLIPTEPQDWVRTTPKGGASGEQTEQPPQMGICWDAQSGEVSTGCSLPPPAPIEKLTNPAVVIGCPGRQPPPGMSLREFSEWDQGWSAQSDQVRGETQWTNFQFQEMSFGDQLLWGAMQFYGGDKMGAGYTGSTETGRQLSFWERVKTFGEGLWTASEVATSVVGGVGILKGGLTATALPAAGEDLFVGTYSQSRRANILSGLNSTHTPHHAVQDAVSVTSRSSGVTINLRKDLHELTRSFGKNVDLGDNTRNLAADIWDLRGILRGAGYDRSLVNQQLQRLIELNRQVGNVP